MSRSDDRKIKELVDRLVAMSPEPPPFPEEVSVTQREESSKMRPVLVFAGAALVVLLAAGIPLLSARLRVHPASRRQLTSGGTGKRLFRGTYWRRAGHMGKTR